MINKLHATIKDDNKVNSKLVKKELIKIARMRSEAGKINAYNRIMKCRNERQGPKDAENDGK